MVVGAFPIAKLAGLLVKQVSKPIANACKENAKKHPFFRTYVCMPPAQFYNWCEVKAKMWILNLGKPVNIPVLSQEMAIELGANLLGEGVIFLIGSVLLIFEYNRQAKKETAKELKREEEMNHINSTISELFFTVQKQETQLKEMERLIHSISGKTIEDTSKLPASPPKAPTSSPPGALVHKPEKGPVKVSCNNFEAPSGTQTPYPNTGIILRSLNYIQMDVFSSTFSGTATLYQAPVSQERKSFTAPTRRQPAVLTGTLHSIENELKSLF